MRLVLLRHGQTPSNVAGALDTAAPGAELTPLGHRQATAVVDGFADVTGVGVAEVDGIYASDRVRTQLTAAPLAAARGLEVPTFAGFGEVAAGAHEMSATDEAVRVYLRTLGAWVRGDLDVALPGGESGHDFLDRFDGALADALGGHGDDARVVVVSHGAAIRAFTARRTGDGAGRPEDRRHLANTGCAVLDGDPERGWRLVHWREDPVGGAALLDETAHDVTGEG